MGQRRCLGSTAAVFFITRFSSLQGLRALFFAHDCSAHEECHAQALISGVSAIYLLEPFAGARGRRCGRRWSRLGRADATMQRVWGRLHKAAASRNLNSHLRNYAFSRTELVDKGRIISRYPLLPSFRIGAYTFAAARDVIQSRLWQLTMCADLTFYTKPSILDSSYGKNPVSFQVFLRVRPALSHHEH